MRHARESGTPFLGICLGMQCAAVEFARNVVGLANANSTEFDPETPFPVVDLLPEQREVDDIGGTMRLGAEPVELVEGTRAHASYGETTIYERHRHRYEVNNAMRPQLEAAGLRRLGRVRLEEPRRGARAAEPPVVRRLAVPPRVQEPSDASAAALPRLRRARPSPSAIAAAPRATGSGATA